MVVCRFFLEGKCKFGGKYHMQIPNGWRRRLTARKDNCKNEHPRQGQQSRFAPLTNNYGGGGGRARSGGVSGGDRYRPGPDQKLPYHLDIDALTADLTPSDRPKGEKPEWQLSSYGPGRDAPRQLLEGLLEQSPEEMRVLCYLAARDNKLQDYLQHESTLNAQALQQAQSILSDIDGAIKYVIDGEQQHPNRNDQVVKNASPSTPASGGFGQPSGLGGEKPSSGGFGQPSQMGGGSAFGHPSGLGQARSAFGQPSQPSGAGSPFGQPSQLGGGGSAFGQASSLGGRPAFGQPTQPPGGSAFGTPSQPGAASGAFGSPSALGQPKPAFGQPSQPAFGQSPFGQAPKPSFGQPTQPAAQSSPFGAGQQQQPNPFAAKPSQPSPYGQAGQASGFAQAGQSQPTQASPFATAGRSGGQTGGFGISGSQAGSNPFGVSKPAAPASGAPSQPGGSPFGQPAQSNGTAQPTTFAPCGGSIFGQPSQPAVPAAGGFGGGFGGQAGNTAPPPAPSNSPQTNGTLVPGIAGTKDYTTRSAAGHLLTWKGQPVEYDMEQKPPVPFYRNPQTGKEERIWHPNGMPEVANPDAEASPREIYVADIGAMLREVYDYVKQHGDFKDVVPEVPPKREWVRWDL